jgi:3'(2'), 5'-bisphosphate nucleotidase
MLSPELKEISIKAAKKASQSILEVYNSSDFDIELKGDQSPLTKADKLSHNVIEQILAVTNLPVLSEEGKTISYQERKNWEYFWLVDPLDGTKEFLKRNGEFTVNIALMHKNAPVWGVVYVPVQEKMYSGGNGEAWMEIKNEKIKLNPKALKPDLTNKGIRVVASRSHLDEKTQSFLAGLNEPMLVSMGSSLKFMMLAEGNADVYPRFAPTMEWDTAAAHAILNALNWKVLKENSESELKYNKENLLNPGFIVN